MDKGHSGYDKAIRPALSRMRPFGGAATAQHRRPLAPPLKARPLPGHQAAFGGDLIG
ncbi:hypothetical protein SAMN05421539_106144 [Jannaschia seohaensis]|uniref:Uncharacterized protein n=1 Tax=Jannaschia seohaensis TaxID=475081 RepID=A0A2Y9C1B6_9RHOB|nr:hypothetical protein BCF38_106144 [Jannaschia seohaensis]SSA47672.1 hypothetical protein SAMN05421539_106144 [Jannaschia seohaensis]